MHRSVHVFKMHRVSVRAWAYTPTFGRAPLNVEKIHINAEQSLALQQICLALVAHAEF